MLACLLDMPYGYYQFVRFAAAVGFVNLAYDSSSLKRKSDVFIFISLAILFQPLIKISLGRVIWNIVDVAVAIFLMITIILGTNIKAKPNRN